jgi:hypothetical protein
MSSTSSRRVPEFDEEWGNEFVTQIRAHMEALYESVLEEAEAEDDVEVEQNVISGQPFCGCEDCDERERYLLATILILEGHEQGRVRLVDVDE